MKKTKYFLMAIPILLLVSGCLTSQDAFYEENDIVVDDRLVGTYGDKIVNPQSSSQFSITKDEDYYHKGRYYITITSGQDCSMKFAAVSFQIGTNRFLDLLPVIEPCDRIPANPPSMIEILQATTIQPMHMVVKVDANTNGVGFSFLDNAGLMDLTKKYPEYFRLKTDEMPRMVPDTKRQREFLLRFGSDTNIFKVINIKREK